MWTFKREQESCEEDQAEFELKGNMRVGNIDSVFMKQVPGKANFPYGNLDGTALATPTPTALDYVLWTECM